MIPLAQAAPPSIESAVAAEWSWTPDVILFVAAAVMTLGVIAYAAWLFVRASRDERRAEATRGRGEERQ